MKIVTDAERKVRFGYLKHDETFMYNGYLYTKINWLQVDVNAVSMHDFMPVKFVDNDEVIPVSVTINMEYKS